MENDISVRRNNSVERYSGLLLYHINTVPKRYETLRFHINTTIADISFNQVISPNRYIGLHIKGPF